MGNFLSKNEFSRELGSRARLVDEFLQSWCDNLSGVPERLAKAMRYSLEAGGKRIRPVLCVAWGELAGGDASTLLPFAAAIEMIHTYSLIHDDLPAMDDDDLRRGRPSSHKAFDEATAILAGDALLTDAFTVALATRVNPQSLLKALGVLARAAGSGGMAGGQMLDMLYTGEKDISLAQIDGMEAMKTGAMLKASCLCGVILAQGSEECLKSAEVYGGALGKAFQITDDILDITGDQTALGKPVGSDAEMGKNTWPALAGLEASAVEAAAQVQLALGALKGFSSSQACFLGALVEHILARSA